MDLVYKFNLDDNYTAPEGGIVCNMTSYRYTFWNPQLKVLPNYIDPKAIDLLMLSLAVYGADRIFLRKNTIDGWKRRIHIHLPVLEIEHMNEKKEVIKALRSMEGIGDTLSKRIYRALFEGEPGNRGVDAITMKNEVDVFPSDKVLKAFMKSVVSSVKVEVHGEADEPVTTDVKRIIRLEGSIHGKTGLRVTHIHPGDLTEFDPLKQCIPEIFKNRVARIVPLKKSAVDMLGETFELEHEGEFPLPVCLFAVSRGLARAKM